MDGWTPYTCASAGTLRIAEHLRPRNTRRSDPQSRSPAIFPPTVAIGPGNRSPRRSHITPFQNGGFAPPANSVAGQNSFHGSASGPINSQLPPSAASHMFLKRNLGLGSQMQHSQLALPMEPNVWAPDMATTDARNDAESWLWVDPGMSAFGHRVPQPHTKGYISNDSNGYQGWEMIERQNQSAGVALPDSRDYIDLFDMDVNELSPDNIFAIFLTEFPSFSAITRREVPAPQAIKSRSYLDGDTFNVSFAAVCGFCDDEIRLGASTVREMLILWESHIASSVTMNCVGLDPVFTPPHPTSQDDVWLMGLGAPWLSPDQPPPQPRTYIAPTGAPLTDRDRATALERYLSEPSEAGHASMQDIVSAASKSNYSASERSRASSRQRGGAYTGSAPSMISTQSGYITSRSGRSAGSRLSLARRRRKTARHRHGTSRGRSSESQTSPELDPHSDTECDLARTAADRPKGPLTFFCTFCRAPPFTKQGNWARHEEDIHLGLPKWICAPRGPLTEQKCCVYCRKKDSQCRCVWDCAHKPASHRTFGRKGHLKQHLERVHGISVWHEKYDSWHEPTPPPAQSRCGFCGIWFDDWAERKAHIALAFRNGKKMHMWKGDWGLTDDWMKQLEGAVLPDKRRTPWNLAVEYIQPNAERGHQRP